jgi:hypothetical protein
MLVGRPQAKGERKPKVLQTPDNGKHERVFWE